MRRVAGSAVLALACALSTPAGAARLTLDEALATVSAAHPDRRLAESDLALSRADRELASSRQDFSLFLDGSLRTGRRPDGDWKPDNIGRIVARKPLLDFGRTGQAVAAADQEIAARQAALLNVESLRRIDIMARYFDVLLADQQYVAENEFMTVAFLDWDKARERFELGVGSRPELLRLEAFFQDWRERRNASQQRMQSARQKLAHAMHRPDTLPTELAIPELPGNARPVPGYDALLPWVMQRNPRVQILQAQLAAADARPGRAVPFDGLTEEWRIVGNMHVVGRMSDALNKREAVPISDVHWAPADGSEPMTSAPGLKSVDPYDLIMVLATQDSLPPLSDSERVAHKVHKIAYDVALEVPPFRVVGTVYLYPGSEPDRLLDRATEMFVPIVDATAYLGDRALGEPMDAILVNRFYLRGVEQVDRRTGERHQRLPGAPLGGVSYSDRGSR